jgi:hypothetical protein
MLLLVALKGQCREVVLTVTPVPPAEVQEPEFGA